MTQTNLLERRKKLEQRKNRLKQIEASLSIQERKKRTRKLIELGGLVSKAQLEDWSSNTLLGGLLFLKEKEFDTKQLETWTHKGGIAFSSEKISHMKTPVIIKFEEKPSNEIRKTLKSSGLKWNSLRQEWEGYTNVEDVKTLLADHKASIQDVSIPM